MNPKFTVSTFVALSLCIPHTLYAEPTEEKDRKPISLAPIIVVGDAVESTLFKVNQTAQDLGKNLVQDEHDLFRNEVGIGVNESGRSGSNGFAIRGVDKDRVAVIVDGLPQAETFMPSIYKG